MPTQRVNEPDDRDAAGVPTAVVDGHDTTLEVHDETPAHDAVVAPEAPAPRGLWSQVSSYQIALRDIFASSVGQVVTSYTLDSAAVSADANGDKIVYEGTVLEASSHKVKPRTSGTAVGVCSMRVNLRDGDADIGMVVGGRLRTDKLWDNGTFGTVAGQAQTDLATIGVRLVTYDQ